jgi:hypothetical protein
MTTRTKVAATTLAAFGLLVAPAVASAETVYRGTAHHHGAAVATGTGVVVVALAGAAIAAFALLSIPRVEKLAAAPTSS